MRFDQQNFQARRAATNDPSSATRPTRRGDCNQSAMAGRCSALLLGRVAMVMIAERVLRND
jgi:hypothetical protein